MRDGVRLRLDGVSLGDGNGRLYVVLKQVQVDFEQAPIYWCQPPVGAHLAAEAYHFVGVRVHLAGKMVVIRLLTIQDGRRTCKSCASGRQGCSSVIVVVCSELERQNDLLAGGRSEAWSVWPDSLRVFSASVYGPTSQPSAARVTTLFPGLGVIKVT
jgi:hypothetical protein